MNSASLCSLAGRYENPIPPRFLAPIEFLKIPALNTFQKLSCTELRREGVAAYLWLFVIPPLLVPKKSRFPIYSMPFLFDISSSMLVVIFRYMYGIE